MSLRRTVLMSGKWGNLNYDGYSSLNIRAHSVAKESTLS